MESQITGIKMDRVEITSGIINKKQKRELEIGNALSNTTIDKGKILLHKQ